MKTPEEMAKEYLDQDKVACDAIDHDAEDLVKDAFLAGYKAAKDEYKAAIDTYNDVAKQMMEEAVRIMSPKDQLADAGKVMCNTTMEEVKAVDTGELMPITNLPTPAKWISVKERLPDKSPMVLAMCIDGYELAYYGMYGQGWTNTLGTEHLNVTHWHPLPEPPKEEK